MTTPLTADGSVFEVLDPAYDDGVFIGRYRGVVTGSQRTFQERVDFGATGSSARPSAALLRLLALATSLSYFKATRADAIAVGFPLSGAERSFFAGLIEHGLGEYAFVNDAPWKLTPTITAATRPAGTAAATVAEGRPLVAVGGGKDSIVTIEALKSAGHAPLLYSVNDRGAIRPSVTVSGLDYLQVSRVIDPLLITANREGAPNGHVPVTAINSLIGLITAELTGCGPVVFSNEGSADYGNLVWDGREINHQWSKSLAYEDLLRDTLAADGLGADRFFSLLRAYSELEIARDFARHPQYFDAFTSCNRAYRISPDDRSETWCGECPKCAFVFLLLAPYLRRERLVGIFGRDLLTEPAQRARMAEILGLADHKPFECVGEPAEAAEALELVARGGQWADSALVADLLRSSPAPEVGGHPHAVDRVPVMYAAARDRVTRP